MPLRQPTEVEAGLGSTCSSTTRNSTSPKALAGADGGPAVVREADRTAAHALDDHPPEVARVPPGRRRRAAPRPEALEGEGREEPHAVDLRPGVELDADVGGGDVEVVAQGGALGTEQEVARAR